tara:strand:- start:902 stop:1291 length:390 start_codon:yes stop_codon:yes gene_type:complete
MATPYKMKNSALHNSVKHGSPMQGNFTSKVKEAAKKVYDLTTPDGLKIINKKIADVVTGGKGKTKSEVVDFSKKDSNYDVEFTKSEPKAKQTKTKTKRKTKIDKIPSKDTVEMPVANNNARPPKKTSKS